MNDVRVRSSLVSALPFVAFFLSGLSSLIFQTLWSRLLQHVFGSSSIAVSSVVSVFMMGLALGAWLGGRWADRLPRPLVAYAIAELLIGACALLVPVLVASDGWLAGVNAWLHQELGAGSVALVFARFACIAPILIVPTTLMGATLPLLARHFVGPREGPGGASVRVGRLYAVNTLGAVAGVFLAAFVLMPRVGVVRTNLIAACVNLFLAVGVFALAASAARDAATVRDADVKPAPSLRARFSRGVRIAAAAAFAGSGFCALLYEVVWSRALVNTVGGSVYAFALILMTFLVGIAGGSALGAWTLREDHARLGGSAAIATLLGVLACGPLMPRAGLLTWSAASLACGTCVLGLFFAARRARASLWLLDPDAPGHDERWEAAFVAVPALATAAVALAHPERLEQLTACVVLTLCGLVTLLRLFGARPVALLAALQFFIAGATFVSECWADELALTFASMVAPLYEQLQHSVDRVMTIMFATVALCILPAALGMGAMFPAAMRVWTAGGTRIGRDVGVVYTANTVGSIFGAWLPGFLLMPSFGMQATLHVGIGINLLLGLGVVVAAVWRDPRAADVPAMRSRGRVAALAMVVLGLVVGLPVAASRPDSPLGWNLTRMTLGAFRITLAHEALDEETWGRPDLVYYRDGLSTTVSVERWGRHYTLKNNGKVEASNGDDMPTQIMVAGLPLLLHREGPKGLDVAIIGLGSGVTAGAALQFPVRSVDVMELERSVVEASRFFVDVNHLRYTDSNPTRLDTPRLRLIHDDARNHLAATVKSYDLIVSEPSNPWLTGVSDLFTADHFRVARRRLAPGGIYCQWVQLYELSPENVKIIYRTFASAFRHVIAFSAEDLSSDTILLGSDAPIALDLPHVRSVLAEPSVAVELERAYVHSPHHVFARVLFANRAEVMSYARIESRLEATGWTRDVASLNTGACPPARCRREAVPVNTDDNVHIEFAAPKDLIGYERYRGYIDTVYSADWSYGQVRGMLTGFARGARGASEYAEQAIALLSHGRKAEAAALIERGRAEGEVPTLALARALWTGLAESRDAPALRIDSLDPAGVLARDDARRLREGLREALDALSRGERAHAVRAVAALPLALVQAAGAEARLLRGAILARCDQHEDAIDALEQLARDEPAFLLRHPELYYDLARAHDALRHFDKGVRDMRAYVEGQRMAPSVWLDDVAEPSAVHAPTTDAPGVTPKENRADGPPS